MGHQKAYLGGRPSSLGRILDVTAHDGIIYMAEWTGLQSHRIVPDAAAPDLQVDSVVELPRAEPGAESNTGLSLRNLGERPLTITEVTADAPFSVEVTGVEVASGSQALASITLRPPAEGAADGRLTIKTDDPDEPIVEVRLRGNLPGLRTGDEVPDLAFRSLDGLRSIRLSELRGRPVLLAYFATF